jgi:hypothetical protein
MFVSPNGVVYDNKQAQGVEERIAKARQEHGLEATKTGGQLMLQNAKPGARVPPEYEGMTPEQYGKIVAEHSEANRYAGEFNNQLDHMATLPFMKVDDPTAGVRAIAGQRMAPDASAYVQDLNGANMQLRAAAGKMLKDADGKPTVWVQEELKHTYAFEPGDTAAIKRQKMAGARSFVNGLARQQGAGNAPLPNGELPPEAAASLKPYKK